MADVDFHLECIDCGARYDPNQVIYTCSRCSGLLSVEYNFSSLPEDLDQTWKKRTLSVWRYRELLPIGRIENKVSLGEGGTSLNKCLRLSEEIGLKNLYVKNEGENPTGSFKDRGMTVGVTKAVELGMTKVACASTGNTSASLAAYAARAGIECIVLIPSGKVAFGKLTQAIIHGAKVIQIRGNFDEALRIVRKICHSHPIYLLNSLNPFRLEGQKTAAFEIRDQLDGRIPDKIVVPVGNAGNISALWKGFVELRELGLTDKAPQMIGIQAEGAAPIADSLKKKLRRVRFVDNPETVATAIRIGSPVNWKKAVRAVKESQGLVEKVSDAEILEAQKLLAQQEGLFVEPASAASIAGLIKLTRMGVIGKDELVVCILTGHGLKDPNIILRRFPRPIEVEASEDAVINVIMPEEKQAVKIAGS
ncbi:threonine synthase [Candidatus Bathyarchaeota archaeon]|nr:MAG: threonine synthase [Candidatus Bathyarchaeota archaeon]